MKIIINFCFCFCLASFSTLCAHENHRQGVAHEMQKAAEILLSSLTEEQQKAAIFPFDHAERETWTFFPVKRLGLKIGTLTPGQLHHAYALLNTGLSQKGFLTATQIMALEHYLAHQEKKTDFRDTGKYYITIFGTPADKGTWAWSFEGHHLSLNFTIKNAHLQDTPAFLGASPHTIPDGPQKGQSPLGEIGTQARALALALHPKHPSLLFSKKPPAEIITRMESKIKALPPEGLSSAQLSQAERKQLLTFLQFLHSYFRQEINAPELKKLATLHAKKINFAWAGSLEKGQAHYWRIQTPDLLIEYANAQNNANHSHLVIRHLKDDFGRHLLKEHYQKHNH